MYSVALIELMTVIAILGAITLVDSQEQIRKTQITPITISSSIKTYHHKERQLNVILSNVNGDTANTLRCDI